VTIAGNLKTMFQDIIGIGTDRYTMGGKTLGSVLISRMKLAGS
jgi:PmbA protein